VEQVQTLQQLHTQQRLQHRLNREQLQAQQLSAPIAQDKFTLSLRLPMQQHTIGRFLQDGLLQQVQEQLQLL
jgi:hypothetical protein